MPESSPEAKARKNIDSQLNASGWAVQNLEELNLAAQRGVAVREVQSLGGPDYVLFVDGKAMGIPLPPLAELHQIVAKIEVRTSAIDFLEAEFDQQITHSNRLRQATLAAAFQGDLK